MEGLFKQASTSGLWSFQIYKSNDDNNSDDNNNDDQNNRYNNDDKHNDDKNDDNSNSDKNKIEKKTTSIFLYLFCLQGHFSALNSLLTHSLTHSPRRSSIRTAKNYSLNPKACQPHKTLQGALSNTFPSVWHSFCLSSTPKSSVDPNRLSLPRIRGLELVLGGSLNRCKI